ncbi:MAG TPA: hypothetical protein VGR35_17060 [Tepidisphaeraceae bacterium]|nr:hypothetical protein [Tepidisphaeraceae bacterium]
MAKPKKPKKPQWTKTTIPLPADHGWSAAPGYQVFVADRGAVQLQFPEGWVVLPEEGGTIAFHDRQPPDDDCVLRVSIMRLPPEIFDFAELERQLPLDGLVRQLLSQDKRPEAALDQEIRSVQRPDLSLAWGEVRFTDPAQQRPARSRMCLARGRGIQPLITMDFWESDLARVSPVWDQVLRSLRVGVIIGDITRRPLN